MKRLGYLTGPVAVDVARVLDLELDTSRGRYGEPVRYIDLDRLDEWTRFRLGWLLLAVEVMLAFIWGHAKEIMDERHEALARLAL